MRTCPVKLILIILKLGSEKSYLKLPHGGTTVVHKKVSYQRIISNQKFTPERVKWENVEQKKIIYFFKVVF